MNRSQQDQIELKSLLEINKNEIIELMNHPKIQKHMPLLEGRFDESKYNSFIAAKQKIWDEYGYGPWAFTWKDRFMGWGGLQPVEEDVEIALVLHPLFWGHGKTLYRKMIQYAFEDKGCESVIILFPPTRTRIKAVLNLGFKPDGEYVLAGHRYLRYRLHREEQ